MVIYLFLFFQPQFKCINFKCFAAIQAGNTCVGVMRSQETCRSQVSRFIENSGDPLCWRYVGMAHGINDDDDEVSTCQNTR